ncbi:MAG: hypothetical protein M3R65_11355 [Gemmatimonadota bacterium]|nr:hypothetical protein [Gemmatimonadota bacterium]
MPDKPPDRHHFGRFGPGVPVSHGAEPVAEFLVRPVVSLAEFRACVAIQEEVWGAGFVDVVSASVLQIASHIGGIVLGAFTPTGAIVGFVAGFTGFKDGRPLHWSHMLGVREVARNAGVGRMLKERQRGELKRMGIPEMQWTFDPLVAKNAHFNLNRLGACVTEYVRDMYGNTGSMLHGTVSDRIIVSCPTNIECVERSDARLTDPEDPFLTTILQPRDLARNDRSERPPKVWIEIPHDIASVIAESPGTAAMWRLAVRGHFEWALGNGYTVTGFSCDPATSRAFYKLEREHVKR